MKKQILMILLSLMSIGLNAQVTDTFCNCENNLIVNGNFEQGNTGFTTQSGFNYTAGCRNYSYSIKNSADCWNYGVRNVKDQCRRGGQFMIVDNVHANRTVMAWRQQVAVINGNQYKFSMSYYPEVSNYSTKPNLEIKINNVSQIVHVPSTNGWQTVSFLWTATSNTATVEIFHIAKQGGAGNSAVDNICLAPLPSQRTCCRNKLKFWSDTQVPPSYYFSGNTNYPPLTYSIETFRVHVPSNIPITDLYASVTSVEYISNNEECKQCTKYPIHFGSIYGLGNIGSTNPLILQSQTIDKNINNGEVHWKNGNGTNLTNGMTIPIVYTLPVGSRLSCCNTSVKVCIRFRYLDKKCNLCEIYTCSTIPLRTRTRSNGRNRLGTESQLKFQRQLRN